MAAAPYICDLDASSLNFSNMTVLDGKQRVDMFTDRESTQRLMFSLCPDPADAFETRFPLDGPREDSDNSRRGQVVRLPKEEVVAALMAIDEKVIETAVARSTDWFKGKVLDRLAIEARYRPLVNRIGNAKTGETDPCLKFKVKVPDLTRKPTLLHLRREDGFIVEHGARIAMLEQRGAGIARLAPILSSFGLWFMGGGSSFGISVQAEEIVVHPPISAAPLSRFACKRELKIVKEAEHCFDEEDGGDAQRVRVELHDGEDA